MYGEELYLKIEDENIDSYKMIEISSSGDKTTRPRKFRILKSDCSEPLQNGKIYKVIGDLRKVFTSTLIIPYSIEDVSSDDNSFSDTIRKDKSPSKHSIRRSSVW